MSLKQKKGVSKEELRRLMKQQKSDKTITHPLAKYNALGNLMCTACNCQVKSDRLWNPHLMSRSHKECVERLKRKSEDVNRPSLKRSLPDEPLSSQSKSAKVSVPRKNQIDKPKSILKNPLVPTQYSSDDDSDDGSSPSATEKDTKPASSSLPSDFFDTSASSAQQKAPREEAAASSGELPEGFFDDGKADAKARNVQFVEKEAAEYDKFMAEIKQEEMVSEQLEAVEDELNTGERHLEEIDEQLAQWTKVNAIVMKKEKLMEQMRPANDTANDMDTDSSHVATNNDDDDDDIDLADALDWRSKMV